MAMASRDSMAYEVENTLRTIFKRCVQCPPDTPACPTCPKGQVCSLTPASCSQCQFSSCVASSTIAPPSPGPNVGAIAGGVVGGVVFIVLAVFLLWRFNIRKKRLAQEAAEWEYDDLAIQKSADMRNTMRNTMRSDAASSRTRNSMATSILSRASNIIQIAYIPGISNRNGTSSHNSLAPVPPIPAMYANNTPKSPLANDGDMLFFHPTDLRGSTYSGTSSRSGNRDTQYTQFSRNSITPSLARSSMMSEAYRDDATAEPMPATTVMRAAPRMVSVKGASPTPPSQSPNSLSGGSGQTVKAIAGGTSNTSPKAIQGGVAGRATQVTVGRPGSRGKGKGRFPVRSNSDDATPGRSGRRTPTVSSPLITTVVDSEDDDQDEHARARQSLIKPTQRNESPSSPLAREVTHSPFFDASEPSIAASMSAASRPNPYASMSSNVSMSSPTTSPKRGARAAGTGLAAVIEEATRKASKNQSKDTLASRNDESPFADEHSIE